MKRGPLNETNDDVGRRIEDTFAPLLSHGPFGECDSCAAKEDNGANEYCPKSRRVCGHHCNHIWSNDECHWCGLLEGENE